VAIGVTPSHAQAPAEDMPMFVTGEQRARIVREFAELYAQAAAEVQKATLEQKLDNCRSTQSARLALVVVTMEPRMDDDEALVTFKLIAIPFVGAVAAVALGWLIDAIRRACE
jgi:hypothetical protein